MIDWFRGEIPFLHVPIPSGRVLSIHPDGSIDWEAAKAIQCQGSFESSIRIKSSGGDGQGNATTLLIDGNLCKFLQGHNIFGSLDLNMLVYRTFEFIIASGFIELKIQTDLDSVFRNIEKGNYLVKMVDINFLYDVKNDESVESWLHAAEINARSRSGRSCRDKGTVYVQKTSRRWAFKFYNKFREINCKSEKHRLNDELRNRGLEQFIRGKLRAELRLMSLELKELKLTHGHHFTANKLKELFNEYLGRINMNNQATLIDEKLFNLPTGLQGTYQLWRQGANLRQIIPERTFYRHRKLLMEQGVDITFMPIDPSIPNNVVPLMRVIEAVPVPVPSWAYERGLIAA